MADPNKNAGSAESRVDFVSDCDLLEIKEEDTKPGKVSDRYRQLLEKKYGRKPPPTDNGADRPN
jgi:hypothetical protein